LTRFGLLAAAGSGSRISSRSPKQYAPLAGKPMLWHSLAALFAAEPETVFVVLAPADEQFARHDWSAFENRLEPLYCGGETRRDSVYNGLVAASAVIDTEDFVLVHDAARPCLPRADLERLVAECSADRVGGILAIPLAETAKRVAKDEAGAQRIAATEDRSQLWLAQTPQMFRAGLLLEALHDAKRGVTDEAQAIEQMGLRPRLVLGSRENLKVTYPEDLAIAEAILKARA
jgi:2-C-methyl-D-erythritol 4-phosphate cytidylyltransferase